MFFLMKHIMLKPMNGVILNNYLKKSYLKEYSDEFFR